MAQFDVHTLKRGEVLVIDCQSDLLGQLNTRLVVPLIPSEEAPRPAQRLNPVFTIGGREHVMATQFASGISSTELGAIIATLRDRSFEIVGALDVLVSGV